MTEMYLVFAAKSRKKFPAQSRLWFSPSLITTTAIAPSLNAWSFWGGGGHRGRRHHRRWHRRQYAPVNTFGIMFGTALHASRTASIASLRNDLNTVIGTVNQINANNQAMYKALQTLEERIADLETAVESLEKK